MMTVHRPALALRAGIEEALSAVVEGLRWAHAQVALSLALELSQSQPMLVIASLQRQRPALKAVVALLLLAVVADQLDDLLAPAPAALVVVVLGASDVHQHVIFIALQQHWPLLVDGDSDAVVEAILAKPRAAFLIVEILSALLAASHAAVAVLPLQVALMASQTVLLKTMLFAAGAIGIDIH